MSSVDPLAVLEFSARNQLESLLMEFDETWKPGSLDDFSARVAAHPDERYGHVALAELVKIDLHRTWAVGKQRLLEDYLSQFPLLGDSQTVSAELVVAEFEARTGTDAEASLASYESRFPVQYRQIRELASEQQESLPKESPRSDDTEETSAQASIDTSRVDQLRDTNRNRSTRAAIELPVEFGRYRILNELGAGAMGKVYLAHDSQLDRRVALKTPSFSGDDDDDLVTRFYREARAAAKIQHRNICPIFDVGEMDGRHFISMAFIKGRCMSEFIKSDRLPPQRTSAILVQRLALALAEAHRHNVIHRDLKPANIMIDMKKEPIVMDFGLARQTDVESRVTQSGVAVGTPAYMSPEQIRGEINDVGPASDIYSLGVILYELLSGQIPFRGPIAKVVYGIVNETPDPLSLLRQDIDLELEAICNKMMAKNRKERFASMQDVAAALKQYLKGDASSVSDTITSPPSSANASRSTSAASPTETSALNAFFAVQADSELRERDSRGTSVEPARELEIVTEPNSRSGASRSDRNRRSFHRTIGLGFASGAVLLLGIIIYFNGGKIEFESDSDAVVNIDSGGAITVRPDPGGNQSSSDQSSPVAVSRERVPQISPGRKGAVQAIPSGIDPQVELLGQWEHHRNDKWERWYLASLSPDGRRVAFRLGEAPLTISETETKQVLQIPSEMEDATSIAFAANAALIATGHDDKAIRLWDARTFQPVGEPFVSPIEPDIPWVHLSADGEKLIAMANDHAKLKGVSTFLTWDIATRRLISRFQAGMDSQRLADSIDASADGRLVSVMSLRSGASLWDTTTGKPLPVKFDIPENITSRHRVTGMDLSADGSRLAYGVLNGASSYAAILDTATGKEIWNSGKQKGRVHCVQFTHDGKWLASTAGRTQEHQLSLWDVASGKEIERWTYPYESENEHADRIKFLSFSQDGSRLLLSGGHMPVVVWKLFDTPERQPPAMVDQGVLDQRAAAQRILDLGGRLGFVDSGGWKYRLPEGEFRVNNIEFLVNCELQDGDVPLLKQFPELEKVTFWQGKVTDAGFKTLADLSSVTTLNFHQGCGIGDEGLAALSRLDQLESLNVFHTDVTDDGLAALAEMPSLRQLMVGTSFKGHVGEAFLTDEGLVHLRNIENLKVLSVLGPKWTNAAVEHIGHLSNLDTLELGSPTITDDGIEPLAKLQKLRRLILLTPKVSDEAIARLMERLPIDCRFVDKRDKTKYELE